MQKWKAFLFVFARQMSQKSKKHNGMSIIMVICWRNQTEPRKHIHSTFFHWQVFVYISRNVFSCCWVFELENHRNYELNSDIYCSKVSLYSFTRPRSWTDAKRVEIVNVKFVSFLFVNQFQWGAFTRSHNKLKSVSF